MKPNSPLSVTNVTYPRPIFLVGYMGVGKTTFGRALARATGREFIDLDFYIEQRFHRTVSQLFAERGEEGFRLLESAMLREAGEFDNVVVACGGGTPCFSDNMDYMLSRGLTVHLTASEERLLDRLTAGGSRRPLVAGKSREELRRFMRGHLASRLPHYSRAHIQFCGDELENVRQIDCSISRFLANLPPIDDFIEQS
ncbi:MAG: shikimate kinase [Muribaculaceae bacterium]|nr:shikimate kinase [Muribaculaceae bacterium]